MNSCAKLKREKFKIALRDLLLTQADFAKSVGITRQHLCAIASENMNDVASPSLCRKILDRFGDRYVFDDLFFWV